MSHTPTLRRRLLLSGAALPLCGTALWAQAAAEVGVSAKEIVIGQNITLQNGKNAYGVEVLAGIQTFFEGLNAAGGVAGRRLVLRTLDDDGKPDKAEANARQLVSEGAFMLFGSVEGGPSTAVMKVSSELQVPFFGPMAGSPTLRRPYQAMVFPVRAEHREEFRELIRYAAGIGLKRLAFFHADSEIGKAHFSNVSAIAEPAGVVLVGGMPFKSDTPDEKLDEYVKFLSDERVEMVMNHGATGMYEKLIRKAYAANLKIKFLAVNSGSSQMAASLGELSKGLVFAQVMPNPQSTKTLIAREYRKAFAKAHPQRAFSYGSLEGYLTAKALSLALKLAGPRPTRSSFVKALSHARMDLGGFAVQYQEGYHRGSSYVDIALVTPSGKFLH
jgi:branched-chain amino acid transport system substrate-binding protein